LGRCDPRYNNVILAHGRGGLDAGVRGFLAQLVDLHLLDFGLADPRSASASTRSARTIRKALSRGSSRSVRRSVASNELPSRHLTRGDAPGLLRRAGVGELVCIDCAGVFVLTGQGWPGSAEVSGERPTASRV